VDTPALNSPSMDEDFDLCYGSDDSSVQEKLEDSSVKKKKGWKRGATAYSEGDLVAVLDAVEHVLPQQDDDWKKVQDEYKLYAEKYSHA